MSLPQRWALTSQLTGNEVSPSELAQIAAACQLQQTRDFGPLWPIAAAVTVTPFPDPKTLPLGFCPAVIVGLDQMPSGALGFHYTKHRQPAAMLGYDPGDPAGIATTASHEILEAAADPSGNRLIAANIPGVGLVEALVEVADAPEAFTYPVDGMPMSDFTLESFWGSHRWRKRAGRGSTEDHHDAVGGIATAYSFCKRLDTPLTVAEGGYLSFRYPDGEWGQVTWFGGPKPTIRTLGRRDDNDPRSHREWVDSLTHDLAREHVGTVH